MSRRRPAVYARIVAETIAAARVELEPAEYDALLEHLVDLIAEVWAVQVVETQQRAA